MECCICLGELSNDTTECQLPGCGHRVHVSCLMTASQYDVRCPLCRRVPSGVVSKTEDAVDVISLETIVSEHDRSVRRYRNKRYRFLKGDDKLYNMYTRMKDMEKYINMNDKIYDKLWNDKVKQLWYGDADVKRMRESQALERRRYRRLKRRIDTILESNIGKTPELLDMFFT
jgi:hypothetical protein